MSLSHNIFQLNGTLCKLMLDKLNVAVNVQKRVIFMRDCILQSKFYIITYTSKKDLKSTYLFECARDLCNLANKSLFAGIKLVH